MNGAGSEPMGILITCLKVYSPRVKKQLSIKYLIASMNNSLEKVVPLTEGLFTHLPPDLVAEISSFDPPLKQVSVFR